MISDIVLAYTCKVLLRLVSGPGWLSRSSDLLSAGRSGDRNPVVARLSAPVQTDAEAHRSSYTRTMGTGSFTEVKRLGRDFDFSPHLQPRLKNE